MSAFIVSHDHINAMVTAACGCFLGWDLTTAPQVLLDENVASVECRYGAGEAAKFGVPLTIRFKSCRKPLSAVQVLKLCHCYEYQSCEHRGWKTSKARQMVEALKHAVTSKLPGYADADWELVS
jgi:hypothetical protein